MVVLDYSLGIITALGVVSLGLAYKLRRCLRKLEEAKLLKQYAIAHSNISEHKALVDLRLATRQHPEGEMESSEDVGQLLVLLMNMTGAKSVLEIGTFTGVATLKMALALPAQGTCVTLDIDNEFVDIGRPFWRAAGVSDIINVKIGPAVETLQAMLDSGLEGTVDLVFIDADKYNYPNYYDLSLKLVRQGGIIVFDNSMFSRRLPWSTKELPFSCIHEVNERSSKEPSITSLLLTIGDGSLIIRKD